MNKRKRGSLVSTNKGDVIYIRDENTGVAQPVNSEYLFPTDGGYRETRLELIKQFLYFTFPEKIKKWIGEIKFG